MRTAAGRGVISLIWRLPICFMQISTQTDPCEHGRTEAAASRFRVIFPGAPPGRKERDPPETAGRVEPMPRTRPQGHQMQDNVHPTRLTRLPRARLLALATLMSGMLVAGCGGGSHSPTTATRGGASGPATITAVASGSAPSASAPSGAALYCEDTPCYAPHQFRVAYGIQPLLDSGIDGRGETVTVLTPVPRPKGEASDIRQDLESFDSTFGLSAARIEVVTSLAGSASPWRATLEEVNDTEFVHAVAPAATLRVVLWPANILQSVANATADMLAGLRLVSADTDVASISASLGEHYFTKAQVAEMHSILLAAAAHHVTVVASSGNDGWFSDRRFGSMPVKDVSLPASDPLVLGRRHQRLRAAVGWTRGAGRPVRPSRPRPRQPGHLPHRPQLQLPQGISRCHDRFQRLSGRSRMGPGNGLGKSQRAGAHPPAGPLHQPQQDIGGSRSRPASQRRAGAWPSCRKPDSRVCGEPVKRGTEESNLALRFWRPPCYRYTSPPRSRQF